MVALALPLSSLSCAKQMQAETKVAEDVDFAADSPTQLTTETIDECPQHHSASPSCQDA